MLWLEWLTGCCSRQHWLVCSNGAFLPECPCSSHFHCICIRLKLPFSSAKSQNPESLFLCCTPSVQLLSRLQFSHQILLGLKYPPLSSFFNFLSYYFSMSRFWILERLIYCCLPTPPSSQQSFFNFFSKNTSVTLNPDTIKSYTIFKQLMKSKESMLISFWQ